MKFSVLRNDVEVAISRLMGVGFVWEICRKSYSAIMVRLVERCCPNSVIMGSDGLELRHNSAEIWNYNIDRESNLKQNIPMAPRRQNLHRVSEKSLKSKFSGFKFIIWFFFLWIFETENSTRLTRWTIFVEIWNREKIIDHLFEVIIVQNSRINWKWFQMNSFPVLFEECSRNIIKYKILVVEVDFSIFWTFLKMQMRQNPLFRALYSWNHFQKSIAFQKVQNTKLTFHWNNLKVNPFVHLPLPTICAKKISNSGKQIENHVGLRQKIRSIYAKQENIFTSSSTFSSRRVMRKKIILQKKAPVWRTFLISNDIACRDETITICMKF